MNSPSRFNRTYQLAVQVSDDKAVVIGQPLRVVFTVDKSNTTSLNKANIKIYNLKPENRLALVKDSDQKKKIGVELLVGYSGQNERIFKGTVHIGQNSREGPDMVTTLECQDGGYDFRYGFTSRTVPAGKDPLDEILKDMPDTKKGAITKERPIAMTRPRVLVGNSYKTIGRTMKGQRWFVDDETLNVINDDEVVSDQIPIVEAASGLVNTPAREEKKVTLQTMLNPALRVGGLFELKSTTAPHLNGIYKIEVISYDGDTSGSNWFQTVKASLAGEYKVVKNESGTNT